MENEREILNSNEAIFISFCYIDFLHNIDIKFDNLSQRKEQNFKIREKLIKLLNEKGEFSNISDMGKECDEDIPYSCFDPIKFTVNLPPSLQKISKEWYSEADQDIEKFDVIFNGIFLMAWCKGIPKNNLSKSNHFLEK
jgi:hypothetical protein